MKRQALAVLSVVFALVLSIQWNDTHRNPYAGSVIAICILTLAVWLGGKLGKVL